METAHHLLEIKKSYFNLLALLMEQDRIDREHVRCFLKWGFQLRLSPDDVRIHGDEFNFRKFKVPEDKVERMEILYHIIYMIHMDRIIEDAELEVAVLFAQKLGFDRKLVGDLFKSIATISYDLSTPMDVRKEVLDFMKINNP